MNEPYIYCFLVEGDFCLLDLLHDTFKLRIEEQRYVTLKKHTSSSENHRVWQQFLDFLCTQMREKKLFIGTFFLCSFCRSLNCSILFTSSFRSPESWMWRFPTFSISVKQQNIHTSKKLRSDWDMYEVHIKIMQEINPVLTSSHFINRCSQSAVKTKQMMNKSSCIFHAIFSASPMLQNKCISYKGRLWNTDEYITHSPDLI